MSRQQPVIVQGTPAVVYDNRNSGGGFAGALDGGPSATARPIASTGGIRNSPDKGEKQEVRCRDPIFAFLFYVTVIAILAVAIIYGPSALKSSTTNSNKTSSSSSSSSSNIDYTGFIYAALVMSFVAFFASAAGVAILMCIPETMVKAALLFTVVLSGIWMVFAFIAGNIALGIIGILFFAITCCYAYCVWSRIPFATINLITSTTAVKANLGVVLYAYLITAVAAGWAICWSFAVVGIFNKTYSCNSSNVCTRPNYGLLFLLFLAFFFVQQCLQALIHVITAGTVGTWWFEPTEVGCCSPAVNGSFIRGTTTSFGSICFGSLIVAILQALKALANAARSNDDGGILVCIAECILACLASMVEYFNKWAFIYVGLYGYSYLEAGKNVFTLFRNRGWEAVIADDLVSNTLFLVSVMCGGVIGAIGLIINASSKLFDAAGSGAPSLAFIMGFFIGLVVSSIALSVIGSGVNAIVVLFAEAPADFQRNYPDLSTRMRQIWSEIYPGSV